jgi:hypothetical protein
MAGHRSIFDVEASNHINLAEPEPLVQYRGPYWAKV